jgi:hypothetical protein
MQLSEVVAGVRDSVQDTRAPYRFSDELLIGLINRALRLMVVVRPDLFAFMEDITPTAGAAVQSAPANSVRIMEIFNVVGGNGITEVERESMDENYPAWKTEPPAPPVNWMRHVRNPNRYFLYPRPSAGLDLFVEYARQPRLYTEADLNDVAPIPNGGTIDDLQDAYLPIVIEGVIYLAESIDNEHVSSGRAQLSQQVFFESLNAGLDSREIADEEAGARQEEIPT